MIEATQPIRKFFSKRKVWWLTLLCLIVAIIGSYEIIDANRSFWTRQLSFASIVQAGILISFAALGFCLSSIARVQAVGGKPKNLFSILLILPIPFWIWVLGVAPEVSDNPETPFSFAIQRVKNFLKLIVLLSVVGAVGYFLTSKKMGSPIVENSVVEARDLPTLTQCIQNGISYFKEIESYPRLRSTNELVEDVARDRCARSQLAFGR